MSKKAPGFLILPFFFDVSDDFLYSGDFFPQILEVLLQIDDSLLFGHKSRFWKFDTETSAGAGMLMPPPLCPRMTTGSTTHNITPFI